MLRPTPIVSTACGALPVEVYETNQDMGLAAALDAQSLINAAISGRGKANIILATGNSQLTFLHALRDAKDIAWSKVDVFHLDEYVGIGSDHKASFPRFLRYHIIDAVNPRTFYPVSGQAEDLEKACREYEDLLRENPADLAALGIGENGHLAFNEPGDTRFDDPVWVRVIKLEETTRKQQANEGHFDRFEEVPTKAITLTIPALLSAKAMLCIVPEARKAKAVRACLREPISEERPASVLRRAKHARLYLESASAAELYPDLAMRLVG